jgi:undecaprenyl-diphosphatase
VLAVVSARSVGSADRRAVARVNDDRRRSWMRVPQQAGTPWVLPGIAVVSWRRGHRRLAVASALALPVEKAMEVGTKKLSRRPRPAKVEGEVRLHDDAPTDGPSYPSGHAAIAACAVTLLGRRSATTVTTASLLALLVGGVRVHQGAHYPVDAVGGVLLGVTIGSGLRGVVALD